MRSTRKSPVAIERRLATSIPDLAALLGCGQVSAERIARESGAVFYIGKRKFASIPKVEEYIAFLSEREEA